VIAAQLLVAALLVVLYLIVVTRGRILEIGA